jgi:protein-tyrosine sulfotransferase
MTNPDAPIFILGVPRSGTTLLRTMLDSHPAIACGPETPWLGAHQPRSIMAVWRFMREDPKGYCNSFQMPPDLVTAATRTFVETLMSEYTRARHKRRWAEKTPDNALHIPFLLELFPDARFIHLTRGGLDVAASTSLIPDHRRGISTWHEEKLHLGGGAVTANNPFTALLRWRRWTHHIEHALRGREHLRLSYEQLATEPETALRKVTAFIGEDYSPAMLDYARQPHHLPDWEWGAADIRHRPTVTSESIGRARRQLTPVELDILVPLAEPAARARPRPAAALGSLRDLGDDRFKTLMRWLNYFARPLGLRFFIRWSKVWEYPWLWFNALAPLDHRELRVIDLGSEVSPMPWVLALLGARVTLVETTERHIPIWERLRDALGVDVEWQITPTEHIPAADASADVITSFSVLEHQPDKHAALNEAARVLKPGGILALSFDLCEPDQGMAYPETYGRALTIREFERDIWMHPEFGNALPSIPANLNRDDIAPFLRWHRQSAEQHNYIVGAAVMIRR